MSSAHTNCSRLNASGIVSMTLLFPEIRAARSGSRKAAQPVV